MKKKLTHRDIFHPDRYPDTFDAGFNVRKLKLAKDLKETLDRHSLRVNKMLAEIVEEHGLDILSRIAQQTYMASSPLKDQFHVTTKLFVREETMWIVDPAKVTMESVLRPGQLIKLKGDTK